MMKKIIVSFLSIVTILGGTGVVMASPYYSGNYGSVQIQASTSIKSSTKELKVNAALDSNTNTSATPGLTGKRPLSSTGAVGASSKNDINARKAEADKLIQNRIDSLNKLKTRVDAMKRLSASSKASIDAQIMASIDEMNKLKIKIDTETDITALKTDIQSITADYRIYALVMPKIAILAAVDRIYTITDMMTTVGNKLDTRIGELKSTGKDVTALSALLVDYKAKISDANIQAGAAASGIVSLTPDNKDKTIAAANKAALEKAKSLIKLAKNDLAAARQDAENILKGLKAFGNVSIHATSTVNAPTKNNRNNNGNGGN